MEEKMSGKELVEGDKAPAFSLPTDGDGTVTLADLKGSPVVLYFYPKDDTPGCTKEAIGWCGETTDALKMRNDIGETDDTVYRDTVELLDCLHSRTLIRTTFLPVKRNHDTNGLRAGCTNQGRRFIDRRTRRDNVVNN